MERVSITECASSASCSFAKQWPFPSLPPEDAYLQVIMTTGLHNGRLSILILSGQLSQPCLPRLHIESKRIKELGAFLKTKIFSKDAKEVKSVHQIALLSRPITAVMFATSSTLHCQEHQPLL